MRRPVLLALLFINAALMITVFFTGLRGPLAEIRRLTASKTLMETRLAIKERNLAMYGSNLEQWAAYNASLSDDIDYTIAYEKIPEALAAVPALAARLGLSENHFETREPAAYDNGGAVRLYAVSAYAEYEGNYADVCVFLRMLTEDGIYRIERFAVEMAETEIASAKLEFTVYGTEDHE